MIDKPIGPTSMDVCRVVKRALIRGGAPKKVKVGHGGALDPLASGVVVVLIGKATPLCNEIMAGRKRYTAHVVLGHTTPTDDLESEPVATPGAAPVPRDRIDAALSGFVGTIMQIPPGHSAVKVGGRRAYEVARRGDAPVIQPRPVVIESIDVLEYEWPRLVIDVVCGKGTYIRSLARDAGAALGVGGYLSGLRRTESAPFSVDRARALDKLPDSLSAADLDDPPARAASANPG